MRKLAENLDFNMKLKGYAEFLNESAESKFDYDSFIKDLTEALYWNDPRVTEIKPSEDLFYLSKTPEQIFPKCNAFFNYDCLPGESVRKDIIEECKKLGYESVRVSVIFNTSRHERHEYLIGLTVPVLAVTSRKFGL